MVIAVRSRNINRMRYFNTRQNLIRSRQRRQITRRINEVSRNTQQRQHQMTRYNAQWHYQITQRPRIVQRQPRLTPKFVTNARKLKQPKELKRPTPQPVIQSKQQELRRVQLQNRFTWNWRNLHRPTKLKMTNKFRTRRSMIQAKRIEKEQPTSSQIEPIRLLVPNRSLTDLFDKNYRFRILQSRGKKQNSTDVPFPEEFGQMFAISIRPMRFENLSARLGPWAKHLQLWPGTVGANLDKDKLIRDGMLARNEYRKGEFYLRRGEIGCYDSHVRLWRHIVQNNIPRALILEDDADLQCNENTVRRVRQLFKDLERLKIDYDLVYLGHNDVAWNQPLGKIKGTEIGIPRDCQGLFTYLVTLAGARKLVQTALPMAFPVDVHVTEKKKIIKQYTIEPRLNSVVPIETSDTNTVW